MLTLFKISTKKIIPVSCIVWKSAAVGSSLLKMKTFEFNLPGQLEGREDFEEGAQQPGTGFQLYHLEQSSHFLLSLSLDLLTSFWLTHCFNCLFI